MQDSMKAWKESLSRLCLLVKFLLPAARWGTSGVVTRGSDCVRVAGGPRGGVPAGAFPSA